jgi:outer membrane protein assembly factor BamE (lipoprotein component of BamABCDE complex)
MTQIQHFKSAGIRLILIAFLCISATTVYGKQISFKNNSFYSKIELIKPGMTKYDVMKILEQPYKLSFYTNDKKEFVEEYFYKSVIYHFENFFITYRIVFVNDKVTALLQDENTYKEQKVEVVKKE